MYINEKLNSCQLLMIPQLFTLKSRAKKGQHSVSDFSKNIKDIHLRLGV